MWLSVDKSVIGLPDKLMLGTIYIPPENSRFFSQDENSVTDICCNHKYVVISGDANSRTAQLSDFERDSRRGRVRDWLFGKASSDDTDERLVLRVGVL